MTALAAWLREIEQRAEKATPGPWCWEAHGEKSNDWTVGYALDENDKPLTGEIRPPDFIVETAGYSEPAILRKLVVIEHENAPGYADAAFIAAARADVPRLVAALRIAVEALERARYMSLRIVTTEAGDGVDMLPLRVATEAALARIAALASGEERR